MNPSLQATDEAGVLDDLFFVGFLCSEISEGINDDTKDEVEDDDDDHEEEEHVVDESESVERFSAGGWSQHISYSSSVPQSLVQSGDDAHPECVTGSLLDSLLIQSRC